MQTNNDLHIADTINKKTKMRNTMPRSPITSLMNVTPTSPVLSTLAPPGNLSKIVEFQACLQDPQKSEKAPQGHQKTAKYDLNLIPGTLNY